MIRNEWQVSLTMTAATDAVGTSLFGIDQTDSDSLLQPHSKTVISFQLSSSVCRPPTSAARPLDSVM